jgi:G3E family GTPase
VHDEHCDDHGHDHGHDQHDDHDHGHDRGGHAHEDQSIKGVALTLDRPVDGVKVTRWLNEVLQAQGPDILRAKGIIDVEGEDRRLVFQAVHMILDGELQRKWKDGERRWSRLVFIGRNLDEAQLRKGFEATAA